MKRTIRIPVPLTPFFGREVELHAISRLLDEPGCRLITLTGPGGIGKTRLALEAARQAEDLFDGEVFVVPLDAVSSIDLLPLAVTDALRIVPSQVDPFDQLIQYIRGRRILLVLDNFEHLVDGAEMITHLLGSTENLKILATSREALNLKEEWIYPLSGIDVTPPNNGQDESSAVTMFTSCARRARPDFSLASEITSVTEICHLVEGMPLAIELAASWTRMLRCEVIAREIKENIRFLSTSIRNIPERHRSILAVFEQTWRMLKPDEQQVFKRLAVFRGGFDLPAAQQVASASLPVLSALADKSLLRRISSPNASGSEEQFALHELLRQFAQELLAASSEEQRDTLERHAAYYLTFLQSHYPDLHAGQQQEAIQTIQPYADNILAAWDWAVEQGKVSLLVNAVQALDSYYQFQSRFVEGSSHYQRTVSRLEQLPDSTDCHFTLAQVQVCLGWFYIRIGKFDAALTAIQSGQQLYRQGQVPPQNTGSHPTLGQAILAEISGDFTQAAALAEQVLAESEQRGDAHNAAFAKYVLASASLACGQYEKAQEHAQEACSRTRVINDQWFLAYCLNEWAHSQRALGSFDHARQLYLESYGIRQSFNDPEGMALALFHLGNVEMAARAYNRAEQYYRESVSLYADIFDRGGLAAALNGLGSVLIEQNKLAAASESVTRALKVAREINFIPQILAVLGCAGALLLRAGQPERGLALLRCVSEHPSSDEETRHKAAERLKGFRHQKYTSPYDANRDLSEVVSEALRYLQELPEGESGNFKSSSNAVYIGQVDVLTAREVEILRCMMAGLSNKEIAEKLILSLGTVKWYSSQIYAKLQVSSRTQAIAKAIDTGIL
jgi:predicted ATPase/DNA-binding CsgD family transcriptional regulator